MRPPVFGLVGMSGVGKSTVASQLAGRWKFRHLGASELIRRSRGVSLSSHDRLRDAGVDENQQLLIDAFRLEAKDEQDVIVLDAHTLIETSTGPIMIPPAVFKALGICKMVFLSDLPSQILKRRENDTTRQRPVVSVSDIAALQDKAIISAFQSCNELGLPLLISRPSQHEEIGAFLFRS